MAESTVLAIRALKLSKVSLLVSGTSEDASRLVSYLEAHHVKVESVTAVGLSEDRLLAQVPVAQMKKAAVEAMDKAKEADGLVVASCAMCPIEHGANALVRWRLDLVAGRLPQSNRGGHGKASGGVTACTSVGYAAEVQGTHRQHSFDRDYLLSFVFDLECVMLDI